MPVPHPLALVRVLAHRPDAPAEAPRPPRRIRRRATAVLVMAAASLALSACSPENIRLESQIAELPDLTGIALDREAAARTESAAAARAAVLAAKATSCHQCAEALTAVTADSTTRLDALGGLWDPWSGPTPDHAEALPAVPDAPVTVEGFVSWLVGTAQRDLAVAVDPATTPPEQTYAFASVALGRYASAVRLANVYGIPLEQGAAEVSVLASRLEAVSAEPRLQAMTTWAVSPDAMTLDTALPTPDLEKAREAIAASTQLTEAMTVWDCTAQMLPKAELVDQSVEDSGPMIDRLFARVDRLLSVGVQDGRIARCRLPSTATDDLANGLIAADARALTSDSKEVRILGARAALDDIASWTPKRPTPFPALVGNVQG